MEQAGVQWHTLLCVPTWHEGFRKDLSTIDVPALALLRAALFARAPLYGQSELVAMSLVCEVRPEDGSPREPLTRTLGDANGNQV
jgi:hypothetical protein